MGIFVFFAVFILVQNSQYSEYLPKYDVSKYKPGVPPATEAPLNKPAGNENEKTPSSSDDKGALFPDEDAEKPAAAKATSTSSTSTSTSSLSTHSPSSTSSSSKAAAATASTSKLPDVVIQHPTKEQQQERIKAFIQWDRPDMPGHWPGFDYYKDKDYDPNRWEGLDWETGFYINNGIQQLEKKNIKPEPYMPYPEYNSGEWKKQWKGEYTPCEGPRGLSLNESVDDIVMAYPSLPEGFPAVGLNDPSAVGIDETVCFDRLNRFGPYGYGKTGEGDRMASVDPEHPTQAVDWTAVRWGKLQDQCLARNKDRYRPNARDAMILKPNKTLPSTPFTEETAAVSGQKYRSRTAVLIRTWEGYNYKENDLMTIRSLVQEFSLLSGGEYQVYLLVNVKERGANIYTDPVKYEEVLKRVVPEELRDISVLWTEEVCEKWYPKVGDWQVYWSQFMVLQWFSKTHPEFDYIWNWETDARYTGNPYHFTEKIAEFAKKMPRKHLWERNQRFYFPDIHGSYENFLNDTDAVVANATAAGTVTPVWGAVPYAETQKPLGPTPPKKMEADNFEWGVDEEADLITLQPIWDPRQTTWSYRNKIWNFIPGVRPQFTSEHPTDEHFNHPDFVNIPRRVFINTVARFSKRQLNAMHEENLAGRTMQAEMWPATVALQHGLKAVYAPHPIWADRKWPGWYADAIFNADGGEAAQWGQRRDSPYAHDREANFRGWSWYYASFFPRILYRRWLGWKADDVLGDMGGEDFEVSGLIYENGEEIGGYGKMCLPGMLLHPVKNVKEDEGRK